MFLKAIRRVPEEKSAVVHLIGEGARRMQVGVLVGRGDAAVEDEQVAAVFQNPVRLCGDLKQVGPVAEIEAEAEDDEIESAVVEGQALGGSLNQVYSRVGRGNGLGGRLDARAARGGMGFLEGVQTPPVAGADLKDAARFKAGLTQQGQGWIGLFALFVTLAGDRVAQIPAVSFPAREQLFLALYPGHSNIISSRLIYAVSCIFTILGRRICMGRHLQRDQEHSLSTGPR